MATKGSSIILRIYFAAVSLITLITLMWGAIDLLSIGLKTIVPGADQPTYLENCDVVGNRYAESKPIDGAVQPTPEEERRACEARNADSLKQYEAQKAADIVRNLALLIVAIPLFVIHFRVVYKDWKNERD